MNDQLQKQLADMLARMTAVAEDAGKFAADQIPPLIHEKIVLGRVEETLYVLIGVLLLAVVVPRLVRLCARETNAAGQAKYDEETPHVIAAIASGFGAGAGLALGVALALGNLHDLLTAWFAPRLYIIEWLHSIVKQ